MTLSYLGFSWVWQRRVRESIHDLMYYNWQGEKYVVHNYGTTQHMLKKLEAKSRKE